MISLKFKLLVLTFLVSMTCMSQNCKNSKKMSKKAKKHLVEENILKATPMRSLFSKFSHGAATNLVKSDKGYYLSLLFNRDMGRRVDILDTDPIVFQFKNDSVIIVYPDRSHFGKFTVPVTLEVNKPFYKISAKQLEQLATQAIIHVKIYFTSDKVPEEKRGKDDIGTFFDYEILSERYQSSLIEAANCILQE